MARHHFSSCLSISLAFVVLYSLLSLFSSADIVPTDLISSTKICQFTPYPSFWRSKIPNYYSGNVYDYGRLSVLLTLSSARRLLSLTEVYLRGSTTFTRGEIGALRDCHLLAELNTDFLRTAHQMVNNTKSTLSALQKDDMQMLLRASLTNTQTCLDGLQTAAPSWSARDGIFNRLGNDTKMYSVSLSIISRGFVVTKGPRSNHPNKKQLPFGNGKLPLKMSEKNKAIFEGVRKKKLLQTDGDQVLVSGIVVVSRDGTGNFTTINDAVAVAPINTVASNGYFLIYITAGVYKEVVSIAKNKKYLMMFGDGIDQTIVTGNNSVADGSTTFNSATFAVVGQGFAAVNMTFRNTAGAIKNQAVAVRNGADLSTFYSCSFEGYQNTLYVHFLRQFYRECDVYGTVDFIFGNAVAVFQNCNIYPRLPMSGKFNAITAQGQTDPTQNIGISIKNCTIWAADDLASNNGTTQTYLGRRWKQYSRTVVMQSFLGSLINP